MTANSTPESFDAVLAEMRCPLVSTREIPHDVVERMFRNIANRLQSAHARELAEQQATIEALRGTLQGIANANYREWDDGVNTPFAFVEWAKSRAANVLREQALAGGERKE